MGKESYTATLIRIDERLRNFIESNSEQHKEIIVKIVGNRKEIDVLCNHVNDENKLMDARLDKLEKKDIADYHKYKGRLQLFKWASIALSIIVACLTTAQIFKVI